MRNGIPVSAISEFANEIKEMPSEGIAKYGVELNWESATRSRVKALPMQIGDHKVNRQFEWVIDEPRQLLGTNQAPNPQEYLLSGLGACMMVAFTVGATMMKIQLEDLKITVKGELNLAGFLNVDCQAPVGFKSIDYKIEVSGDGTPEQFEELRQNAIKHSPNAMTLLKGTQLNGELLVA